MILVRKVKNEKIVNIDEIIFYLKSQYLLYNDEERTFIDDIPSEENMPSFEAITGYLKTFSKSITEDENMRLKNKTLMGGWILIALKVYRLENLSCRFDDLLYQECRTKRQTSYNYRNPSKFMSVAPKLNQNQNHIYFSPITMFTLLTCIMSKHNVIAVIKFTCQP